MKQYHILLLTLIFNTCQKTLCMEFFPDDLYIKIIACCDSNSKNELGKSCKKLNVLYSKNNLDLYYQSPLSLTEKQKAYALSYCTYKNCTVGVKNLLEHGAYSKYQGLNTLFLSIKQGHLECVKSFLKYDPSLINKLCVNRLNVSTTTNETKYYTITLSPLAMATFKKYYHIAEYLLSYDSIDINKAGICNFTPLYAASEKGAVDILQLLLKQPKLDATSYMDAYSALHIACQKKHTEIVKLLVTHYPKLINMKDKENGNTALHIAALYNGIEEVKILLQTPNIDVDLTNCDDETAFDIAQRMQRPQIRTLLLKKIWSKNNK